MMLISPDRSPPPSMLCAKLSCAGFGGSGKKNDQLLRHAGSKLKALGSQMIWRFRRANVRGGSLRSTFSEIRLESRES